jgi:nicotinamide-nucleotide amidase
LLSNSNIGISTTGIAGPTGGTSEKPIGLIYVGISSERVTIVEKHQLSAERMVFKEKVFEIVLSLLEKLVNKSLKSDF